jgi:DNA topoisomerase-3
MDGIADLTKKIVDRTKKFNDEDIPAQPTNVISPSDGKPMMETWRSYRSQDDKYVVYKIIGQRKISLPEVAELLEKKKIGPLDGFRSKKGRPFSAMLRIDEENKVKFLFDSSPFGEAAEGGAPIDLTQFPVVGQCPVDGAPVHETPSGYVCANYGRGEDAKCKFRVSRVLLGATIVPEQFKKLIEFKKTDLIKGFKSKRTGRFFEAFLVLKDKGQLGFEFNPRKPKGEGKGKGGKAKTGEEAAAATPASAAAEEPKAEASAPAPKAKTAKKKGQTPPPVVTVS